jgi:hypothetical protein
MSYLPALLSILPDIATVENGIKAYHAACLRQEWNGTDTGDKQRAAFNTIKRRLLAAANRLDVAPDERDRMTKAHAQLKLMNEGLLETIERQREQIAQLTAANAGQYRGRYES